jgi:heat-inducible transcriptional repressor
MTRSEEILKLIVEHFIKTAEPVGSKTLKEAYNLKWSSATIRIDMTSLEKDGYIEKPHTSGGRIPTKKGYAYYCEHLRGTGVDDKVKYALQSVFTEKTKSVEEVIRESCEILSNMTNLASVVLGPSVNEECLARIQIIPLSANTATAVFVTDKGYVENKTFIVDKKTSMDQVEKTVEALNARLAGTPISELVPKMEAMRPAFTDYMVGQEVVYHALLEAFVQFTGERVAMYGEGSLLEQPEFAKDAEKLKKLLKLLRDPDALRKAVDDGEATPSGVSIKIGSEKDGLQDVALMSAELDIPGSKGARLTVLGPTRMDYEKVAATLKYFATELDRYFAGQGGSFGELTVLEEKSPKAPKKAPAKKTAKKPAKKGGKSAKK